MADRWRPQRSRSAETARAVQSMVPGSMSGRVASARPVPVNVGLLLNQTTEEDLQDVDTYQIQFWQDEFTLTADGPQTLELSFEPLENSEHVYWNGLYQREHVAWSRVGYDVTLIDGSYAAKIGDRVTVEYAYESGELAFEAVAFESPNWKYLIVGETDMTLRSAPGYDDSGWNVGQAAFGWPLTHPAEHAAAGMPLSKTGLGNTNVGVWMRRTVGIPGSVKQLSIRARVDGQWRLFFDGTLIGSGGGVFGTDPFVVEAPSGQVVVALHVYDEVADPLGDWIYADVEIVEA